jgi:photosystem II stability/assembly factor-like uncharacterized protein
MVNSSASFTGIKVLPDVGGIFVAKLDPQGALIYTFLHPYGTAAGIAVDAAGSAYVAGTVYSNAPANSATQTFGVPGDAQAMVFKVSADGSKKLYETTLGGSIRADGMAIAVDRTGAAYLAGTTTSVDFPLVRPLQSTLGARPLWKSSDGGATWVPLDDLPFAYPQTLLVDPPGLYAATWDGGIFMGLDSRITSNTWNPANHGLATTRMQALAIDPQHPQVLYAATAAGVNPGVVYKTVDGGNSWRVVDSSPSALVEQFAVDARNPSTVYSVWNDSETRKTLDSGATWSRVPFPGTAIATLAPDPQVSGSLWAYSVMTFAAPPFQAGGSPSFIYHSTNGGTDWVRLSSPAAAGAGITVDASTNPSTLYAGLSSKSVDGGVTWSALSPPPGGTDLSAVAVDPNGVLYAASPIGMFVSHDRAQTWTPLGSPAPPLANYAFATFVTAIVPAGASGTLYALVPNRQTCGFVTKLSADGSNIAFSTLLRGHVSLAPLTIYAAEPGVFTGQNWIDAIALDAAGNVVVAGGTRSNDFPIEPGAGVERRQGRRLRRRDLRRWKPPDLFDLRRRFAGRRRAGGHNRYARQRDSRGTDVVVFRFPGPGRGATAGRPVGRCVRGQAGAAGRAGHHLGAQRRQFPARHRGRFLGHHSRHEPGQHQSGPHLAHR